MRMQSILATATLLLSAAGVASAEMPPMPATPAAAAELKYARPVRFTEPMRHTWSKENRAYTEGWVLVIRADPALLFPRATGMPVLMVGDTPAQVLNSGHESGHAVVIVPGPLDLKTTPIYFGSPGLPGEMTNAQGAREKQAATNAGIKPFAPAQIEAALKRGGNRADVPRFDDLGPLLAKLVEEHSPQERATIEALRGMKN